MDGWMDGLPREGVVGGINRSPSESITGSGHRRRRKPSQKRAVGLSAEEGEEGTELLTWRWREDGEEATSPA